MSPPARWLKNIEYMWYLYIWTWRRIQAGIQELAKSTLSTVTTWTWIVPTVVYCCWCSCCHYWMSPTGAWYKSLHSYVTTFIYSVRPTCESSILLLRSTVLFSAVSSELVQKPMLCTVADRAALQGIKKWRKRSNWGYLQVHRQHHNLTRSISFRMLLTLQLLSCYCWDLFLFI